MSKVLYRYTFMRDAPIDDIEASLVLAILATESLHGEAQTRLDAAHCFDSEKRSCVIDASTAVGRDLSRIFGGFLSREFGPESFCVERVEAPTAVTAA
jgi:hypothetical protein